MKNRLKTYAIFCIAMLSGSLYAGRDANIVNCCSYGGMVVTVTGGSCTCTVIQGGSGRARGDVFYMDLHDIPTKILMSGNGTIQIPQVGSIDVYQYGSNEIIVGSFSLKNLNLNPKNLTPQLKRIFAQAKAKFPWGQSLVWVAQVTPNQLNPRNRLQVVEITETVVDTADLSQAEPIAYQTMSPTEVKITIPKTKNAEPQSFTIDFKPIKKESIPHK